jgi:hypothetical protein
MLARVRGMIANPPLRDSDVLPWRDYSIIGVNSNGGRFRYLVVRVDPEAR